MNQKEIERIIQNVRESLKSLDLKDGDFLSHADERFRLNLSPYRMTLELRFPEGLHNLKE